MVSSVDGSLQHGEWQTSFGWRNTFSSPARSRLPPSISRPTHVHKNPGMRKLFLTNLPCYSFLNHVVDRIQTHRQPELDYQTLREKTASQKRDVERALTRFIAKTGETESLFSDDPYAFPRKSGSSNSHGDCWKLIIPKIRFFFSVIANKPKPLPYLDAILPKEQESEFSEEESKDKMSIAEQQAANERKLQSRTAELNEKQTTSEGSAEASASAAGASTLDSDSQIDNPYLRAIIMPRISRTATKQPAYTSSLKW